MADIADKLDVATVRLEAAAKALSGFNAGNQSHINVNAGGLGVWIACTACAVMLAVNVFLIVLYVDQQAQIRQLGEYLQAVYMMAPSLRSPEKKP
jgi:hypothetical protein